MSERQPYSRIYWSVLYDEKFVEVRSDMRHFGSWSLMLVVADMAYPAPAFVPPTVPKRSLEKLAEVHLIDRLDGGMFRVRGLTKEREGRSGTARANATARWSGSNGNANGMQADSGRNASQVIAETGDETRAETEAPRAPDPADAYWSLTGKYPNGGALSWIDDMSASYGPEAVVKAIAKAHVQDKSASTLLGRAQDILRSEARALSLQAQTAERKRLEQKRAEPRQVVDQEAINAEIRKLLEVAA